MEPPLNSDGFLDADFVMDSQAFLRWLPDYYKDDLVSLRLIVRMMGMQKPGGQVHATQIELANLLGVKQSQISRSLKEAGRIGLTAKVKAGVYQLHPTLSLRGGKIPVEPKPGTRARGTLQVDQLSLMDFIANNEELPDAFRYLRNLPDPATKPPREDKQRAYERELAREKEDGS
ncbi:hypothetical protein [Streptomyces sp. MCC20]|uniref:hypothetical protein n=1 Tax=Streptomyces sediminimaris TaxID=3383721 RepID=UPI003999EC0C